MNPSTRIDSGLSLDAGFMVCDTAPTMIEICPDIHLKCIDPARNKKRYYCLSLQTNLFGEISLIRYWGRLGSKRGQYKTDLYLNDQMARTAMQALIRQKLSKGYQTQAH
jgi:predicted DNA-binding WGR domain protein